LCRVFAVYAFLPSFFICFPFFQDEFGANKDASSRKKRAMRTEKEKLQIALVQKRHQQETKRKRSKHHLPSGKSAIRLCKNPSTALISLSSRGRTPLKKTLKRKRKKTRSRSKERMDKVRVVVHTPQRQRLIAEARRQILGDQADERFFLTFNTRFSYQVVIFLKTWLKRAAAEKNLPNKLDLLFATTYYLGKFNAWIDDHESGWDGDFLLMGEFTCIDCRPFCFE
jgi:hypothetical protein